MTIHEFFSRCEAAAPLAIALGVILIAVVLAMSIVQNDNVIRVSIKKLLVKALCFILRKRAERRQRLKIKHQFRKTTRSINKGSRQLSQLNTSIHECEDKFTALKMLQNDDIKTLKIH